MNDNIGSWYKQSFVFSNSVGPINVNPIAWYDSSDVATITKDVDNKVSQWNDKSGNAYNLTSPGANQPTYSAVNGVVFNVSNYMNKSFGTTYNTNMTIFVVAQSVGTGYQNLFTVSSNTHIQGTYYTYAKPIDIRWIGTYPPDIYIQKVKSTYPLQILTIQHINTTVSEYVNNIFSQTGTIGQFSIKGFMLSNISVNWWNGYIKEVLIYNSDLSTEQIGTVNNYLNQKYIIY